MHTEATEAPTAATGGAAVDDGLRLVDGSRIAVIGSGPAGSLFACFLLDMARHMDLSLQVDLWDPKASFAIPGPGGCNMCGGIISETLVQNLAAEGVSLSTGVVQRGIDSYVLHTDVGSTRIATPLLEMRIGAVHRGAGPRDAKNARWESFDHHLQARALERGARLLPTRVEAIARDATGRPTLTGKDGTAHTYDLAVAAVGVNSTLLKLFEGLGIGYTRPVVTKTLIREYHLGEELITRTLGSAMHVFLLDLPRLEFAAAIPKGDYVTIAVLGEEIDNQLVDGFLASKEVRACMPPGWDPAAKSCQCMPAIAVHGVEKPFADRFLFIGDCGVTRLYKDGIGAAYRTAKAAARAAVFGGISEADFRKHYLPVCRSIAGDNRVGKVAFLATRVARHFRPLRRAMLRMAAAEQGKPGPERRMSGVLWDMFSGSAPYTDIFLRMIRPGFLVRFAWAAVASLWPARRGKPTEVTP
jgi:flavin-dependent dehydrogenase